MQLFGIDLAGVGFERCSPPGGGAGSHAQGSDLWPAERLSQVFQWDAGGPIARRGPGTGLVRLHRQPGPRSAGPDGACVLRPATAVAVKKDLGWTPAGP